MHEVGMLSRLITFRIRTALYTAMPVMVLGCKCSVETREEALSRFIFSRQQKSTADSIPVARQVNLGQPDYK